MNILQEKWMDELRCKRNGDILQKSKGIVKKLFALTFDEFRVWAHKNTREGILF